MIFDMQDVNSEAERCAKNDFSLHMSNILCNRINRPPSPLFAKRIVQYLGLNLSDDVIDKIAQELGYNPNVLHKNYKTMSEKFGEKYKQSAWWGHRKVDHIDWEERTWQAYLALMARDEPSHIEEMLDGAKLYVKRYKEFMEGEK